MAKKLTEQNEEQTKIKPDLNNTNKCKEVKKMANKRLNLSDFIKKFKKDHPEMKSQQATKKAKLEYKKYIKQIKKDKKEEKDFMKGAEADAKKMSEEPEED